MCPFSELKAYCWDLNPSLTTAMLLETDMKTQQDHPLETSSFGLTLLKCSYVRTILKLTRNLQPTPCMICNVFY